MREGFTGGAGESRAVIEIVVIETPINQNTDGFSNYAKIHPHARLGASGLEVRATDLNGHLKAVSVQSSTLSIVMGQAVRGLEAQGFREEIHQGSFQCLWVWVLSPQPGWVWTKSRARGKSSDPDRGWIHLWGK